MPHSTHPAPWSRLTAPLLAALGLSLLPAAASAFPNRVNQLPNGNVHECDNCHAFPGGPRNAMGAQVEMTLVGGNVDWSAIYDLDADGDGFTNGRELGDPDGTWTPGTPHPPYASNPNDSGSVPGGDEGPDCFEQEVCFGMDADCDGMIDEGYEQLGQPCMETVEGCRFTGTFQCNFDGVSLNCVQQSACLEDGDDGGFNNAQEPDAGPMIFSPPPPKDEGCAQSPGRPAPGRILWVGLLAMGLLALRRRQNP